MADDKPTDGAESGDEIKNVKSEFARKTDNLQKMLQEQNQRSEAMMQAIISMQQAKAAAKQDIATSQDELDDIGVDPIDDPKKFAKRVMEKATQKAVKISEERAQEQARSNNEQQGALLALAADYPELNDTSSDIYKQALELSRQMPEQYRNSAVGLKAAVREAAANLGVLPVSKRTKKDNDDDFTVDSGSGEGRQSSRPKKGSDSDIDANTKAFAELLGRPIDDPKYIEKLKKISKRQDWKRYK